MEAVLQRFPNWLIHIGDAEDDTSDVLRRKILLIASSVLMVGCAVVWGGLYYVNDEPLAAAVPWSYVVLWLLTTLAFSRHCNYAAYEFTQLVMIVMLPFVLQLVLGGFLNSSAVVLWSLICPIGVLVLSGPQRALRWFLAFLLLVVICAIAQSALRPVNNLPRGLVIAFFAMNIAAISAIVFTILVLFIRQRDMAYGLLRAEQEKSEGLLLNILPKEIAAKLKERGDNVGVVADHYEQVSVIFADVVNFTPLSAELPPQTMVGILNEIFVHFDGLVDKHGVEKIETVGDEYMAACGVPRRCDDHAQAVARLALDMCDYMRARNSRVERKLDIRVGIHSGPVVGGVIGRKKFAFELFGDTVNTANRMQSHGEPGKIQISRATYDLIRNEFVCEPRGFVPIKGKGEMETWFVVKSRPSEPFGTLDIHEAHESS